MCVRVCVSCLFAIDNKLVINLESSFCRHSLYNDKKIEVFVFHINKKIHYKVLYSLVKI